MTALRRTAVGRKMAAAGIEAIIIVAIVALVSLTYRPGTPASPATSSTSAEGSQIAYLTTSPSGPGVPGISPGAGLHSVTFRQAGACSPKFWGVPWSVTIGNKTQVQPAGTSLPLDDFSLGGTTNESLSAMTFLLPDGTYQYQVHPAADRPDAFFTPDSGVVSVSGADVGVTIAYTGTSCVTTTASP